MRSNVRQRLGAAQVVGVYAFEVVVFPGTFCQTLRKIKKVRKINIMYLQVDKECHVDVLIYRVSRFHFSLFESFLLKNWRL